MPFFMGITGVNQHVEPLFNAVLPRAVIMLRFHILNIAIFFV
ncbi:MAG: hypothetical protein OFPII_00400 [Osedax symbiont Rs1]|nr:MAG: hypothetical protein OFPII_00400 [Osedax symbiont Rs1]